MSTDLTGTVALITGATSGIGKATAFALAGPAYQARARYGAPRWEVEGWVTSYTAIAAGELAAVSDTVRRLTGHPPVTLAGYITARPDSLGHVSAALVQTG